MCCTHESLGRKKIRHVTNRRFVASVESVIVLWERERERERERARVREREREIKSKDQSFLSVPRAGNLASTERSIVERKSWWGGGGNGKIGHERFSERIFGHHDIFLRKFGVAVEIFFSPDARRERSREIERSETVWPGKDSRADNTRLMRQRRISNGCTSRIDP